jgi:hypothetical protein
MLCLNGMGLFEFSELIDKQNGCYHTRGQIGNRHAGLWVT